MIGPAMYPIGMQDMDVAKAALDQGGRCLLGTLRDSLDRVDIFRDV